MTEERLRALWEPTSCLELIKSQQVIEIEAGESVAAACKVSPFIPIFSICRHSWHMESLPPQSTTPRLTAMSA